MYPVFISNISVIAQQLRQNYGCFSQSMTAEEVCVRFARRMIDCCLPEEDILMIARISECFMDFRGQLEDWAAPCAVIEE